MKTCVHEVYIIVQGTVYNEIADWLIDHSKLVAGLTRLGC